MVNPSRPFRMFPAAALVLLPLLGHGQGLSLEALIRAGLSKNRELLLKRQEVHTASVDTLTAATAVNPHLGIEARHNLTEPDQPKAGIVLSKEFQPGIRGRMKRASQAEWEARQAGLKVDELDLIERIRTAYFEWQALNRKLGLQEAVIERWEGLARLAGNQMAQGKLSEVDQAEMQLNAVRARRRALALRSDREGLEERLRLLTGESQALAPLDSVALDTLPEAPPPEALRQWAAEANPLLASLEWDIAAEKQKVHLEEGLARPSFSLSLGYEREGEGENLVGGGIEMPLAFFNRNQAGILKAKSSLKAAELRKSAAAAALESEIAEAHRRLTRLGEQYSQYRSQARDLIRKQLRLAESGFRQGMLGVFDLSRVQAEYLSQEEEALDILEAYYREWNRLGKAVGGKSW